MSEPIRIAQIMGKWFGGGVESVVINYYRNIDRSKFQFDFICDSDSTNIPYDEILSLGGRIILVPPYQKLIQYEKTLQQIFKENQYSIVHSHINTLSVFPLRAAKKAKVPIRIAHCHSTSNKKEWKRNILKQFLRPFSKKYATHFFSCSEYAGRWLFGNETYNNGNVYVLKNAINIEKFRFNSEIRIKIRQDLEISENTFVIGHIGRFMPQKNHDFIIDIFSQFHSQCPDSILLLVGHGTLMEEIQEKVISLGLKECVFFLGQKDDVSVLYQAFDAFLFPSLYEGFGLVLLEAQCSGCPCIASYDIPKEIKLSNKIQFLKLSEPASVWAEKLLSVKTSNLTNLSRQNNYKEIQNKGFDITINGKKLMEKYTELYNIISFTPPHPLIHKTSTKKYQSRFFVTSVHFDYVASISGRSI